jgi:hypothetical protein
MNKNFLRSAIRNLLRNKSYSFLNVFGLAIGVACAGIIFLWVEDELNYDSSFFNKSQIYQVMTNQTYDGIIRTFPSTPGKLAPALEKELPGVLNACRVSRNKSLFSVGDKAIYESGIFTDSSFLPIFSIEFLEGNPKQALTGLNSVVISEKMAKKFFGISNNIVGREIKVDNKINYRITEIFRLTQPCNLTGSHPSLSSPPQEPGCSIGVPLVREPMYNWHLLLT